MDTQQILDIAREGRLWLDENGVTRVLRRDPRSGRNVAGRRVSRQVISNLRATGLLRTGTNSDTFTMLWPAL